MKSFRNSVHNDREFTARWKILAWKKWWANDMYHWSPCSHAGHPHNTKAAMRMPMNTFLICSPRIASCYFFVTFLDLLVYDLGCHLISEKPFRCRHLDDGLAKGKMAHAAIRELFLLF